MSTTLTHRHSGGAGVGGAPRHRRGFTLVEITLALMVSGIILSAVVMLASSTVASPSPL